jgi:hypothetical protein
MAVPVNVVTSMKQIGDGTDPIDVDIQTYSTTHVYVYYGDDLDIPAISGVDFHVTLDADFAGFQLQPTASLVAKAGEDAPILIERIVPLTNDFSTNDANIPRKVRDTMDRAYMGLQQVSRVASNAAANVDETADELEALRLRVVALESGYTAEGVSPQVVYAEYFREDGFTDTQTIQAFFDHLALNGGKGISIGGPYVLTEAIEVTTAANFQWDHYATFTWTAGAATRGIKITVGEGNDVPSCRAFGGKLFTDAFNEGCALYIDNYLNLNPDNEDAHNYGPTNTNTSPIISGFHIAGSDTVVTTGWNEGAVFNCASKAAMVSNYVEGCRNSLTYGIGRFGLASIWRNRNPRTISNITVDGGTGAVTVTWSAGLPFQPAAGDLYVYFDDLDGDIGEWLNGRSFESSTHDNTAKTVVLDAFDGRELPPYEGGGILEQSPSHSGFKAIDNQVNWARIGMYATQHEGYYFEDNRAIGCPIGFLFETQLAVKFAGFNHSNSVWRSISIRDVGGIYPGNMLLFTRAPSGRVSGLTITKGITTTGAATQIPWFFYEGCWVFFNNSTGMTELNDNYYKLVNLDRDAGSFKIVDAITGAEINSSGYAGTFDGRMLIVGEQIHLEECRDFTISDVTFNGTSDGTFGDMLMRTIIAHNCSSAGPNVVRNNRVNTGATYALVEATGDTNYLIVHDDNAVFPGELTKLLWDKSSGTSNLLYGRRTVKNGLFINTDTNFKASGQSQVSGGGLPATRFDYAGTLIFVQSGVQGDGRQHALLNSTEPDEAGAGLAIISHRGIGGASRFSMPDRMPRFLMPGEVLDLLYDEAKTAWRPINSPKFSDVFDWFDDYLVVSDAEAPVNTTGAITSVADQTTNAARKPIGVAKLDTGAGAAGAAALGLFTNSIRLGLGCALFVSRIWLDVLQDGSDQYDVQTGFQDAGAANASVTDGVYWEYNATNSVNWQCCCSVGGVHTRVNSGLVAADTVVRYFGVFVNGDGTRADFFYSTDGQVWTYATSIATNIPTSTNYVGMGTRIRKSLGTNPRAVWLDWQGAAIRHLRGV